MASISIFSALRTKALVLSLLFSMQSLAGGVNGGGSDHLPPDFGAAWFLQGLPERTIRVCIEQDVTAFPLDHQIVKAKFTEAMLAWEQYITTRKINDVEVDEEIDPVMLHLVTKFRFQTNCQDADLTLYLGKTTPEIDQIRSQMFDPSAFAYRQKYDVETGWGKGLIWLSGVTANGRFPWDKNDYLNLYGILLHELGHVFGIEHIPGTIMAADFADDIADFEIERGSFYWSFYRYSMTQLDQTDRLVQARDEFEQFPEADLWLKGSRAEREAFKFLTGRLPSGDATAKVHINKPAPDAQAITGHYTVSDQRGSYQFPVTFNMHSLNFSNGGRLVFARYRYFQTGEHTSTAEKLSEDFTLNSLTGYLVKGGLSYALVLEGTTPPYIGFTKYPEDMRENAILERVLPYRLQLLHGHESHVIYAKNKWLEFNDGEESRRIQRSKSTLHR
jgi:hypothetical protein